MMNYLKDFSFLDRRVIFNGCLILAEYDNKITFADSYNIFPSKLEKIGEHLGFKKLETPKIFFRNTPIKNYKVTTEDKKYCLRDCQVIYKALENIFNLVGAVRVTKPWLS